MAAKVIVELQAIPGRRAELKSLIESIVAEHGPRSWTYGVSVTRGCEPRIPGLVETARFLIVRSKTGSRRGVRMKQQVHRLT